MQNDNTLPKDLHSRFLKMLSFFLLFSFFKLHLYYSNRKKAKIMKNYFKTLALPGGRYPERAAAHLLALRHRRQSFFIHRKKANYEKIEKNRETSGTNCSTAKSSISIKRRLARLNQKKQRISPEQTPIQSIFAAINGTRTIFSAKKQNIKQRVGASIR
jgi:hypothetical protein